MPVASDNVPRKIRQTGLVIPLGFALVFFILVAGLGVFDEIRGSTFLHLGHRQPPPIGTDAHAAVDNYSRP